MLQLLFGKLGETGRLGLGTEIEIFADDISVFVIGFYRIFFAIECERGLIFVKGTLIKGCLFLNCCFGKELIVDCSSVVVSGKEFMIETSSNASSVFAGAAVCLTVSVVVSAAFCRETAESITAEIAAIAKYILSISYCSPCLRNLIGPLCFVAYYGCPARLIFNVCFFISVFAGPLQLFCQDLPPK